MLEDSNSKLLKQVKKLLHIDIIDANSHIIALAISNRSEANVLTKISCKAGMPIKGYVYDAQNDNYCVECVDHLNLGPIPIQINLSLQNDEWKTTIPVPDKIIEKKFNFTQKKQLKEFKKKYPAEEFIITYMQFKI